MLKRLEIQVLRRAGQIDVARLAGVARRTVQRIDTEAPVADVDTARGREARGIGRPANAEPFRAVVAEILAQEPRLLSVEILRRVKLQGYTGGKTALYGLISALRPKMVRPLVRFEGLPGVFPTRFRPRGRQLSQPPREARALFRESIEVLAVGRSDDRAGRAHGNARPDLVDHFAAIGGVPLLAVFDRAKTVALEWDRTGQVTEWNPLFAGVALDLSVGIEVCWPAAPWQKGSVENLVGWVKGSFFKQRRFVDDDDGLRQLAEWRTAVNTERPCRATKVIPAVRLEDERPRLRALADPAPGA